MKAAVLHEFGQPLSIEQVAVKEPKENQVLIKVITSGVCHTDLHACMGDWPIKPKLPLIPGHEAIGYVVALGKGVKNVKEGDIVGAPWLFSACGCCEFCITDGKPFAKPSRMEVIVLMAAMQNMWLPTPVTWLVSRLG
ncbi:alcohol dehydrogenase catalytic domain-containing protein [Pedobacter sp. UC225_65]|uniref:alcohol dehydrogenase catalytic domain-containing protein n=1 Tax=Pedobacter sp. UC225_65 TaxID=3350173 RepID=UPI00366AC2AA